MIMCKSGLSELFLGKKITNFQSSFVSPQKVTRFSWQFPAWGKWGVGETLMIRHFVRWSSLQKIESHYIAGLFNRHHFKCSSHTFCSFQVVSMKHPIDEMTWQCVSPGSRGAVGWIRTLKLGNISRLFYRLHWPPSIMT